MNKTWFHSLQTAAVLGAFGVSFMACSQRLLIRSEPSGARVYLNNVEVGMAPLAVHVPNGPIRLRIEKKGYESRAEEITVRPTSEVNGCLVPTSTLPEELFYRLHPVKSAHSSSP